MLTTAISYSAQSNTYHPNRSAVATGSTVTLSFTAGHVEDNFNSYATPTVVWLKDGTLARTTPTNMAVGSNGRLSSSPSPSRHLMQESISVSSVGVDPRRMEHFH